MSVDIRVVTDIVQKPSRRHKIANACLSCQKKKTKCSGPPAPCTACQTQSTECIFHEKPERPQKVTIPATRMKELEARIQELEQSIQDGFHGSQELGFSVKLSTVLTYAKLPPGDTVAGLLEQYFNDINSAQPLIAPAIFWKNFEQSALLEPSERRPVLIVAKAMMVLVYQHRATMATEAQDFANHNRLSTELLKDALSGWESLVTEPYTLVKIQAALAIVFALYGTPTESSTAEKASTVFRIAHSLALAQDPSDFALLEQKINIFWLAYILTRDLHVLFTRSPSPDASLIGRHFPMLDPYGATALAIPNKKLSLFELRVCLARVQSQIETDVYAPDGGKEDDFTLVIKKKFYLGSLKQWLSKSEVEVSYEVITTQLPAKHQVPWITLYLSYLQTLAMVHSMTPQSVGWRSRIISATRDDHSGQIFRTDDEAACVPVARSALMLLRRIGIAKKACYWQSISPLFSALLIVMASILQNPHTDTALHDFEIVMSFMQLLDSLVMRTNMEDIKEMHAFCAAALERVIINTSNKR